MSLILEALRKSEAQRRLGEAPNLATQHGSLLRPRQRTRLGLVIPVLGLALLGAGWLWYDLRDQDASPALAEGGPASNPSPAGQAKSSNGRPTATQAKAAATGDGRPNPRAAAASASPSVVDGVAMSADGGPLSLPQARVSEEEMAEVPARLDPRERSIASQTEEGALLTMDMAAAVQRGEVFANNPQQLKPFLPTEKRPLDLPDEPLEPTGTGNGGAQSPHPTTTLLTDTARLDGRDGKPSPPVETRRPSRPETPPATGTPRHAPATTRSAEEVPALWEMPYAYRKEIQALNITMHFFHEIPEQRFVIINGRRQAEGWPLANEIFVHEIVPDGVVFIRRNQKFFIAR